MSERVMVAEEPEIQPGERKFVTVNGNSIGVFNIGGEYHALKNECAHQHGPVCTGKIMQDLVGEFTEPGKLVKESFTDTPTIACPWHGWEYDIRTGVHLGDSSTKLITYHTIVEDGQVFIEIE